MGKFVISSDGTNYIPNDTDDCETSQPLKARYYIKELLDSEVDNREDLELIGYDECYDFSTYHN